MQYISLWNIFSFQPAKLVDPFLFSFLWEIEIVKP